MKLFYFLVVFIPVVYFSSPRAASKEISSSTIVVQLGNKFDSLLIGKWQVDSSGKEMGGKVWTMYPKLDTTYWEFTKKKKLNISGNISLTAPYTIVDSSIVIDFEKKIQTIYKIRSLTNSKLVIATTASDFYPQDETVTVLKKVK
jgi:hypothetical protein